MEDKTNQNIPNTISKNNILIKNSIQPRYGHSANLINKDTVLFYGGVKEIENVLTMTSDIIIYKIKEDSWEIIKGNKNKNKIR